MEYISREEILAEYDRQHKGPAGGARKIMETWPAADVVPVRPAKWIKMTGMMPPEYHGHYECSLCGWHGDRHTKEREYNYCPNCGAKME